MKAIGTVLSFLLLFFVIPSCKNKIEGEGPINLHDGTVKTFDKLYLEIPAHVVIEEGDTATCAIACQDNIFGLLYIHNVGKKLIIEANKQFVVQRPIEIRITTPKVDLIEVTGDAQVDYNPSKYQSNLKVSITGSGKVNSKITCGEINATIDDNGDLTLSGKADLLKGELNGPGDIHAYDLIADQVKVEINGSGNVRCSPSSILKASIHGSGDIYYKGTPEIKSEITGSGQIKRESK